MTRSLLDGNEAIAWGALDAGCQFYAGYPITPATTIFNTMMDLLPPNGGICLQCEDEIASIGSCLGASMAGKKVMTATSGPGLSLYSENISFAIGGEIPIVIVVVQRLGPSTGIATRGADSDIQFMRWGNSGGLPVITLAPSSIPDCYTMTMQAFNLAEQYRCPVFIATNKEIGMTKGSVNLNLAAKPSIVDRRYPEITEDYQPFRVTGDNLVPDFLPMGHDTLVRQNSLVHGPDGYITIDPAVIDNYQQRLNDKVESKVDQFTYYESFMEDAADTLLITYGISARAAREAQQKLKSSNQPVSLLILKTLWPVPAQLICGKAADYERIVTIEMNLGQYHQEIERLLPHKPVDSINQLNGSLISPETIIKGVIHA
jgi:2-oxoglutarate ferredoxin oxidoreductase subunit alpha